MERYNFKTVEKKWQSFWDIKKTYKTQIDKNNCQTVKDNTTLGEEIKLAILKKAATIQKSEINKGQKEYTSTGPGRDEPAKY